MFIELHVVAHEGEVFLLNVNSILFIKEERGGSGARIFVESKGDRGTVVAESYDEVKQMVGKSHRVVGVMDLVDE